MADTFQLLSQRVDNTGQATPTDGGAVFPPLIWNDDFTGDLSAYVLTGTPIISDGRLTFGANQDCRITLTDSRIIGTTRHACVIAKCGVGIDNTQPGGNSRADIWINMNDVRYQLTNLGGLRFFNQAGSSAFPTNSAGSSSYSLRAFRPFWMRYIVFEDMLQADLFDNDDPIGLIPTVTTPTYHGGLAYNTNFVTSAAKRVITPQLRLNAAADGAPFPSVFWVDEWWVWSLDSLTYSQ